MEKNNNKKLSSTHGKSFSEKLSYALDHIKFPLLAILLSFIVGAFFIIWTGNSPYIAYTKLFKGSLGDLPRFGETLLKTTPIIFTGLSVAFAFRTGLFNIGAEGQVIMGSLFAVITAYVFRTLPSPVLVPMVILSGALGGAIWAFIPGVLKAKLGVHEVIVTIMLNYTALAISNYLVENNLNPSTLLGTKKEAFSVMLTDNAKLSHLNEFIPAFEYSSVHTGIILALIIAIATYFILFKTTLGYELRSVGNNPDASEYGGISKSKNIILAMVISGVFAGLAGSTLVAGLTHKVSQASMMTGYGFDGITVALVGANHPIGVIASALLFGVLNNGARSMQFAGIPKEVVGIIQGIIIIFIAGEAVLKYIPKWKEKLGFGTKAKEVK